MEMIENLIGPTTHHLTWYQMGTRAFIVFVLAILMVRIAGRRTFGKNTTFDVVVGIVLGGILSRSITGEVPFWESVFAGAVLVALHRLLAVLIYNSKAIEFLVKGNRHTIFENGQIVEEQMKMNSITKDDLMESVHATANLDSLDDVDKAYEEITGRISVIKKKEE